MYQQHLKGLVIGASFLREYVWFWNISNRFIFPFVPRRSGHLLNISGIFFCVLVLSPHPSNINNSILWRSGSYQHCFILNKKHKKTETVSLPQDHRENIVFTLLSRLTKKLKVHWIYRKFNCVHDTRWPPKFSLGFSWLS